MHKGGRRFGGPIAVLAVVAAAGSAGGARPVAAADRAVPPDRVRQTVPAATDPVAAASPGGGLAWQPVGRSVLGRPVMFRAASGGVDVAWLDPNLLVTRFVAGSADPGGPWSWGGEVPPDQRRQLVAAFNGGFKMQDVRGGWFLDGRTLKTLVPGEASFVIYRGGRFTIGEWGRDVDLTPDVVAVRQNLPLLVDNGQAVPAAATPGAWGGSVAGVATARSAAGIDAQGGLVLAQARVTPAGLAAALIAAGAVRAMQLDINPDWTTFVVYSANGDGSISAERSMGSGGPGARYLAPQGRDFFAVFVRTTVMVGAQAVVGKGALATTVKVRRAG